jgi:hypothetical protein
MAEPKTRPTGESAADFIATRAPENRRADSQALLDLFTEVTGEHPVMWGDSIVGFGRYTTGSGKKAFDWPLTGFSPRKAQMTIYIMPGFERPDLLDGLGKYTTSVSCLYFKTLSDLDTAKLKALIRWGYETMKIRYNT